MNIELCIREKEISVECYVEVDSRMYEFALASNWQVKEFLNNGEKVENIKQEKCVMQFRPAMTKYTVEGLEKGTLVIRYSGLPQGNFSFLTDKFIHFSFYNGWYPTGFDVVEKYTAVIDVSDEYRVLKGTYDESTKLWTYTASEKGNIDCNIICFNSEKTHMLESDNVNVYWFDDDKTELSTGMFTEYAKVCDYYCSLYGNNKLEHTDIVFVPGDYQMGAYMRDGLIVFTEMSMDMDDMMHVLGHEIGHAYANGADVDTYNDWLNETHAEWSALLFAAEKKPDFFTEMMERYEKEILGTDNKLNLRECGDRRPDNVHVTGTAIYFEIYKRFGADAVAELLRIFDRLEKKNTDAFIEKVSEHNQDVAGIIRSHL